MTDHPRVVFEHESTLEEMAHAEVTLDRDGKVVTDRAGTAGRKATPSEMEAARDARAARKKRPYVSPPPTNHHREIPGDGVARGA